MASVVLFRRLAGRDGIQLLRAHLRWDSIPLPQVCHAPLLLPSLYVSASLRRPLPTWSEREARRSSQRICLRMWLLTAPMLRQTYTPSVCWRPMVVQELWRAREGRGWRRRERIRGTGLTRTVTVTLSMSYATRPAPFCDYGSRDIRVQATVAKYSVFLVSVCVFPVRRRRRSSERRCSGCAPHSQRGNALPICIGARDRRACL